jgi:hypothetical protein
MVFDSTSAKQGRLLRVLIEVFVLVRILSQLCRLYEDAVHVRSVLRVDQLDLREVNLAYIVLLEAHAVVV